MCVGRNICTHACSYGRMYGRVVIWDLSSTGRRVCHPFKGRESAQSEVHRLPWYHSAACAMKGVGPSIAHKDLHPAADQLGFMADHSKTDRILAL